MHGVFVPLGRLYGVMTVSSHEVVSEAEAELAGAEVKAGFTKVELENGASLAEPETSADDPVVKAPTVVVTVAG